MHEVKIRGATRSIYDSNQIYHGVFSEAQKIFLRLNCDQVQAFTIVRSEQGNKRVPFDMNSGMMAGILFVAFLILTAVFALTMWK